MERRQKFLKYSTDGVISCDLVPCSDSELSDLSKVSEEEDLETVADIAVDVGQDILLQTKESI